MSLGHRLQPRVPPRDRLGRDLRLLDIRRHPLVLRLPLAVQVVEPRAPRGQSLTVDQRRHVPGPHQPPHVRVPTGGSPRHRNMYTGTSPPDCRGGACPLL